MNGYFFFFEISTRLVGSMGVLNAKRGTIPLGNVNMKNNLYSSRTLITLLAPIHTVHSLSKPILYMYTEPICISIRPVILSF